MKTKKIILPEDFNNWEAKFVICEFAEALLNKLNYLNQKATKKVDMHFIKKAMYIGKMAHEGQMRKSGEPYISHPYAAAAILSDYRFDTDIIAATILHDTIEDTNLTYEMIQEQCNPIVAEHVLDVTRVVWPDGTKMSAADTVEKLIQQNKRDTLIIKLCDRIHNVQTLDSMSPAKIKKVADETLLYFVPLAMRLEINELSEQLTKTCYQSLGIKQPPVSLLGQHFFDILDSRQLALVFQNNATLK